MPGVERGQLEFGRALREHALRIGPDTYALLDDDAFLEPMGFVQRASGSTFRGDLASVYAGAFPAEKRPALNVMTDDSGRIFLPGLGYLTELPRQTAVTLTPRTDEQGIGYRASASQGRVVGLRDWRVGESSVTLLPFPVSALDRQVASEGAQLSGIERSSIDHRETLSRGMRLLVSAWPDLAFGIERVVRYIVLFDDPDCNSFALPSAHGIVFLNSSWGESDAYFIEDLAHQGGHVLFSAAWAGFEPLLNVPPETPVERLSGQADHRTLEVALHGMVTQALMAAVLDRVSLYRGNADERLGRLYFALVRLGLDLRALAGLEVYTQPGIAILRELVATYSDIASRHREEILAADFSNQPYNFDYDAYRDRNAVGITHTES